MAKSLKYFFKPKNYTSVPDARPDTVAPDPEAFAPIPPPAPYRPVYSYPADTALPTTALQESWPYTPGNDENVPPVRRQKYAGNEEYKRDLRLGAQDGIGFTDDVVTTDDVNGNVIDPRLSPPNPDLGKRPQKLIGNQLHFVYFRPFEKWINPHFDGSHGSVNDVINGSVNPGVARIGIRQGNYSPRTWRLTDRQDPLDADPMDVAGSASSSLTANYSPPSGVRRDFRIS